jgi:hypothetical protein
MEPRPKPANPPQDHNLPRLEIPPKLARHARKTNFPENLKKTQKNGKIDSWANCPHEGKTKMENLHETTELTESLEALEIVKAVSYEFPGVWHINLKSGKTYYLGDVNGNWGWDDGQGDLAGDTFKTTASEIANDFYEWAVSVSNA